MTIALDAPPLLGLGALTVGDVTVQSGYGSSDIVRLRQPNQIPDFMANSNNAAGGTNVVVRSTGLLDLNGFDDTLGSTDGQEGLRGTTVAANGIDQRHVIGPEAERPQEPC